MNGGYADHFSAVARDYAAHRPTYPEGLYAWLAGQAPARRRAWDCATGSGQAARGLAAHFEQVIATDASAEQLAQAPSHPRIHYRVARAEASGLEAASIELVSVAQALHWFDLPAFFAEAERVLVPGGLLAVWTYNRIDTGEPRIQSQLARYYHETVGPYWPPERRHVEAGYAELGFPFPTLAPPAFDMRVHWTLAQLLGYLRSWSATARYIAACGRDPTGPLAEVLAPLWGEVREVRFPLILKVGRKGA